MVKTKTELDMLSYQKTFQKYMTKLYSRFYNFKGNFNDYIDIVYQQLKDWEIDEETFVRKAKKVLLHGQQLPKYPYWTTEERYEKEHLQAPDVQAGKNQETDE